MRAPSAAVISGTADDRRSSAPILASRARRYAANGPNEDVTILAASQDQVRPSRFADLGHHQSWPGGPLPPHRPRAGPRSWAGEPRIVAASSKGRGSTRRARARRPPVGATAADRRARQLEMAVERGCLIVHRDNDHRSRSELAAPSALRCSVPGSGRAPRPGDRRQLAGPLPGRAATCSASLAVLTTSDRAAELTAAGRPAGPVAGDDGALDNTGDHRLRRQRNGAIRQLRTP